MAKVDISPGWQHRWIEFAIESLIRIVGFSSIGLLALIFMFLLREGVPLFVQVPLSNLSGMRWYPTFDLFGKSLIYLHFCW